MTSQQWGTICAVYRRVEEHLDKLEKKIDAVLENGITLYIGTPDSDDEFTGSGTEDDPIML